MTERIKKNRILAGALLALIVLAAIAFAVWRLAGGKDAAPQTGRVDALSYVMELKLDAENDRLSETVTLELKNDTDSPLTEICLRDMTPALLKYAAEHHADEGNEGKGSELLFVRQRGAAEPRVSRELDGTLLRVALASAVPAGATAEIEIGLQTDIPNRQDRFGVQVREQGKIYSLSFCFPYLADNENGVWNTDPFFDDGESRSTDLADYRVTLEAPESFVVAAAGESRTESGRTEAEARQMRDYAIVACDFMDVDVFETEGVRINNYYLKGAYAEQYRRLSELTARDSFRIFTENIGSYIYDELDIVQCLFGYAFGGMEYPGLVMINGTSHYDGVGPELGAQTLAEVITHEIGHQWFYAAVGNNEYSEGWLDEGFTSYLERHMFMLTPSETNDYIRQIDRDMPPLEALQKDMEDYAEVMRGEMDGMYINIPPDEYPEGRAYGEGEYDGGYIFLLEVRSLLGEERFAEFLREYYRTYCLKVAGTEDVEALLRKYDGGSAMEELLRFYLK